MAIQRKIFYRRNLPHWQPAETDFFVTYRLKDSLSLSRINELKEKYATLKCLPQNLSKEKQRELNQEYFISFDESMHQNLSEPQWLKQTGVAKTIMDSLLFNHAKTYFLWCARILPNHVHVLLSTLSKAPSLDVILQNHKKFTAVHCNRLLGREGQFWSRESYDRIIHSDEQFTSAAYYILTHFTATLKQEYENGELLYLDASLKDQFDF